MHHVPHLSLPLSFPRAPSCPSYGSLHPPLHLSFSFSCLTLHPDVYGCRDDQVSGLKFKALVSCMMVNREWGKKFAKKRQMPRENKWGIFLPRRLTHHLVLACPCFSSLCAGGVCSMYAGMKCIRKMPANNIKVNSAPTVAYLITARKISVFTLGATMPVFTYHTRMARPPYLAPLRCTAAAPAASSANSMNANLEWKCERRQGEERMTICLW